jgi:CBS domain containing-hemolysin-like protein
VTGLNLGLLLGLGLPTLALYLAAITLSRALRAYSRSRLEEVCEARGRAARADAIAHGDEQAERAAEALAVLTGLGLAALLGASAARAVPHLAGEAIVGSVLLLVGLGHLLAGIAGRAWAEPILDAAWPLAAALARLFAPLTFVARQLEALAYRRGRGHANGGPRPASVEVEIHHPPSEDAHEPFSEADLPEATRAMIERVVELADRVVSDKIMTPRSNIVALPATATAAEAARAFISSGLSRIPLYGEHRDDIVGVLYAKDLFARLVEGEGAHAAIAPRKLARPAMFVPETKNATELLEELRRERVQLAIVLDEYGGVAGLVTLEDLLEELVGPIDDEHDVPTPDDPVVSLGGSLYEVDASLPIEDLNERLDLSLPTDADFQTVGGLAFDALGRVPDPGTTFRADGVEFTVLEVVDHSIRRLRLNLRPARSVVGREAG